jgi:hypothetical protein
LAKRGFATRKKKILEDSRLRKDVQQRKRTCLKIDKLLYITLNYPPCVHVYTRTFQKLPDHNAKRGFMTSQKNILEGSRPWKDVQERRRTGL